MQIFRDLPAPKPGDDPADFILDFGGEEIDELQIERCPGWTFRNGKIRPTQSRKPLFITDSPGATLEDLDIWGAADADHYGAWGAPEWGLAKSGVSATRCFDLMMRRISVTGVANAFQIAEGSSLLDSVARGCGSDFLKLSGSNVLVQGNDFGDLYKPVAGPHPDLIQIAHLPGDLSVWSNIRILKNVMQSTLTNEASPIRAKGQGVFAGRGLYSGMIIVGNLIGLGYIGPDDFSLNGIALNGVSGALVEANTFLRTFVKSDRPDQGYPRIHLDGSTGIVRDNIVPMIQLSPTASAEVYGNWYPETDPVTGEVRASGHRSIGDSSPLPVVVAPAPILPVPEPASEQPASIPTDGSNAATIATLREIAAKATAQANLLETLI